MWQFSYSYTATETKQKTMTWDNGIMPQFSAPQKPPQNPRKHALGKIRDGCSRCNHQINSIKTNRYNTLDINLIDMNKINIIQPIPKKTCECSVDTCTYCKYEAPHPSPIPSDWSSEDWDGKKGKAREQRLLTDLDPPKPDLRQMTDSEILNEILIQNLNIQEDGKDEEKLPEITDTLVPPSEVAAVTPMMKEMERENIMEKKDPEDLMDQEQKLQKDEEYAIYVTGISKEEESDTETELDECPYFF